MKIPAGLVAGFLIWSSAFTGLYSLHAVGCAAGWQKSGMELIYASPLRLALVAVWLFHVAALVWLTLRFRPFPALKTSPPLNRAACALSGLALAATLVTGAPILALELCR